MHTCDVESNIMPFFYRDTEFVDHDVKDYADLMSAVNVMVKRYADDEDIKEFREWLRRVPMTTFDDFDPERVYSIPTFEEVKDSTAITEGVTDIFQGGFEKGFCDAYVISKKLWVISRYGLLRLCAYKDDPRTVVIPLWHPKFVATSVVRSLYWAEHTYNFVYELAPNVFIAMKGKYPHKKIEVVSSAGASSEHLEFVTKIENKIRFAVELPHSTSFLVYEDGNTILRNRAESNDFQMYLL